VLAFSLPKWSMAYLDSGDTINISGFVKTSTETENGITYNVYTHSIIPRRLSINHKASCRVACISNGT
jgi:hypothetical protein